MSLKAKIEAVIYASEEPVTLAQLVGLLGDEAQAELDRSVSAQQTLSLNELEAAEADPTLGPEFDADERLSRQLTKPRRDSCPLAASNCGRGDPEWRHSQRGRTRRLRSKQVRLRTRLRTRLGRCGCGAGGAGARWPGCARTSACCWTS